MSSATSNRLASYLTVGLGAGVLGTESVHAQIVQLTTANSGINFGVADDGLGNNKGTTVNLTSAGAGTILRNNNYGVTGFQDTLYHAGTGGGSGGPTPPGGPDGPGGPGGPGGPTMPAVPGLYFALKNTSTYVRPYVFTAGQTVGPGNANFNFTYAQKAPAFNYTAFGGGHPSSEAPSMGADSYLGFVDSQGHYGYLEVTWDSATQTFDIIGGAYNATPNEGIEISDSAVPEPSDFALLVGGAAGLYALRRRRAMA